MTNFNEYKTTSLANDDSLCYEQHFNIFQQQIEKCLKNNHIEQLSMTINNYSDLFLQSTIINSFLQAVLPLELVFKNDTILLANYYQVVGKCYFHALNYDAALFYFYQSNSYAFQHNLYSLIAVNTSFILTMKQPFIAPEIIGNISIITPIFANTSHRLLQPETFQQAALLIEALIVNNQLYKAEQVLNVYEEKQQIEPFSQHFLEVETLRGFLFLKTGEAKNALYLFEQLQATFQQEKKYVYLIQFITEQLKMAHLPSVAISNRLLSLITSYEKLLLSLTNYLQKEIIAQPLNTKEQFLIKTNQLLNENKHSNKCYSVILIDSIVANNALQQAFHSFYSIFQCKSKNNVRHYIFVTNTSLCLFVECSPTEAQLWYEQTIDELKQSIADEHLSNFAFAIVNSNHHAFTTIEQSIDLAYAYIYYNFYK